VGLRDKRFVMNSGDMTRPPGAVAYQQYPGFSLALREQRSRVVVPFASQREEEVPNKTIK
jgi:hypothetical protein